MTRNYTDKHHLTSKLHFADKTGETVIREPIHLVAVNHENDTYFGNGLVMGYADCKCLVGLVETLKVVSSVTVLPPHG